MSKPGEEDKEEKYSQLHEQDFTQEMYLPWRFLAGSKKQNFRRIKEDKSLEVLEGKS
jgi:hypothetical protein